MRLLFLTNGFPFPLTSGRLRHYHLMRTLARRHSITLAAVVDSEFRGEHRQAVESFADRVLTVPAESTGQRRRWQKVRRGARSLLAGGNPAAHRLRTKVEALLREQSFDALVLSPSLFPAIAGLSAPPLIADVCDAALMHIRDRIAHAGWRDAALLRLAYWRRWRLEQRVFSRVDRLLFATPRDLAAGRHSSTTPASVVPNGVETDFWKRESGCLGRRTIIFTGAMPYAPNTDAALLLVERVFPLVRRSLPEARLLLVGRDPPPALEAVARVPGITLTGFVDDVRPYLEQATLFAAPLRFGAGIQNKLLEALSMEVPVVTTRRAADGLRTAEGCEPPLELAERPEEFADVIVHRFGDPGQPAPPHADGRKFVETHFNWDDCAGRLEAAIAAAIDCRASQPKETRCQFA